MIEDSYYKWLKDELFLLGELATNLVNGLFTMKAKGMINDYDYNRIKEKQIDAYNTAVDLSFITEKRMFIKRLNRAINKQEYYLHELKKTKELFENSAESSNILVGNIQFSTISGSQYNKIMEGKEAIITKELEYASYSFNRNMSIASTYKYLKWLEDKNPETININPEYVKFWKQFGKKRPGTDEPYLTDEEIYDFLNQAFSEQPIIKTFAPIINKIELRHSASLFIKKFKFDKTEMTKILMANFPIIFNNDFDAEKKSIRNDLDNGKRVFNLK